MYRIAALSCPVSESGTLTIRMHVTFQNSALLGSGDRRGSEQALKEHGRVSRNLFITAVMLKIDGVEL